MDKTKAPPIPEKTGQQKEGPPPKSSQPTSDQPQFVRGTIDPLTKKER